MQVSLDYQAVLSNMQVRSKPVDPLKTLLTGDDHQDDFAAGEMA